MYVCIYIYIYIYTYKYTQYTLHNLCKTFILDVINRLDSPHLYIKSLFYIIISVVITLFLLFLLFL